MTPPALTGTEWLVASNPRIYDADRAFAVLPEVNWSETSVGITVGDVVSLYGTAPIQAITHRCVVTETDVPFGRRIDDARFWTDPVALADRRSRSWMRLRLVREFDEYERALLSLEAMEDLGLNGAPQSRMRAPAAVSRLIDRVIRAASERR
ncbi:hypothetical protein [Agromyces sp. SYSU T0242]|uniref:hypothetical protein n=1 Tax=Agromyces litoreus TaxID=3158561 RepID=UPI00339B57D3